jgi:cell division protease FtsH
VDWRCFTEARDRIMLGQARDSALSEREKKTVAYHESGHALLAHVLPNADPVEKITVIPRSNSLGATAQLPEEDRYNYSESYLRDRIAVMFGGRLAESIVFGEVSNGAESDLEQATKLARNMVSRWGMSERLGPASFAERGDNVFLGQQMASEPEVSDTTAAAIDEEIQSLLRDVEKRARKTLEQHRESLDALAEALQERETLEAEEVREILDDAGPDKDD